MSSNLPQRAHFENIGRDTEGRRFFRASPQYELAFQTLDMGYVLPVDLEADLIEQGYNVPHLLSLFPHTET